MSRTPSALALLLVASACHDDDPTTPATTEPHLAPLLPGVGQVVLNRYIVVLRSTAHDPPGLAAGVPE